MILSPSGNERIPEASPDWVKAASSRQRLLDLSLRAAQPGALTADPIGGETLQRLPAGGMCQRLGLCSRAVSLRWLILFAGSAVESFGGDKGFSTHELVKKVILPSTEQTESSYAELDEVGLLRTTAGTVHFVVHCWSQPFLQLVRSLAKNFVGREATTGIILPALSFNLHEEPTSDATYHKEWLRPLSDSTASTILVLDAEGSCFRSPMCLAAVHAQQGTAGREMNRQLSLERAHTLELLPHALEGGHETHVASRELAATLEKVSQALMDADIASCTTNNAEICHEAVLNRLQEKNISCTSYNEQVIDSILTAVGKLADKRVEYSAEAAQVQYISAFLLDRCGRSEEAEDLCTQATETFMFRRGRFDVVTNRCKELQASCMAHNGNFLAAIDNLRQVVREYKLKYGLDSPEIMACTRDLAAAYHGQGQLEDAEKWYNRAASSYAKVDCKLYGAEIDLIWSRLREMAAGGYTLSNFTHMLHSTIDEARAVG